MVGIFSDWMDFILGFLSGGDLPLLDVDNRCVWCRWASMAVTAAACSCRLGKASLLVVRL